jgi:CBS domain containing-hemolysin-like protein
MISGALNWKTTTANQVYKKIAKIYMLSCSQVVNEDLLKEIKKKSYSRIPVYYGEADRKLIIGVLLVKSLVGLYYPEGSTIQDLIAKKLVKMKEPLYVKPAACVESILQLFKKGTVHQAIVTNDPQAMVKEASAVVEFICAKDEDKE